MGKAVIILLVSLAGLLEAYPEFFQDYNKPGEKWFKAETDHFRVYYLSGLLEQAELAASVAEEVYASVTSFYQLHLPDKVDIIIYDEDYSNGWAWASRNTIKIWVADLDFNLRGTHHWLRDVVTHEFAHIVSIQAGQITRYNIPDIRFGYFDYFNENIQTSGFTVYSFETYPLWFAEGIAQIESSHKGSDSWDSHRDMIMRVKALNDRLLPLEQMNFFAGRAIDAESGYYNQGFAVLRYIEKKYGRETIRKICNAASKLRHPTFNMALKSVIGKSMSGLYDEWAAYEKAKYHAQAESLGALVQGLPLVRDSSNVMGYMNLYPRWGSGDTKLYFISNGPQDGGRGALTTYDFCDTIKEEKNRVKTLYAAVTGFFSLSADNKHVTSRGPAMNEITGEGFHDAFTDSIPEDKWLDNFKLGFVPDKKDNGRLISKIRKSLTWRDHILFACVNHGGDRVVAVRKEKNKNELILLENKNVVTKSRWNALTRPLLMKEIEYEQEQQPVVLFSPDKNKKGGFSIMAPRFSPDDSLVVFSYFDGTSRNVGMVDLKGGFTPLLTSPYDERDPDFTPDGKHIVYSSDRTGIFNIYRMNLETRKTEQLTNVAGGAFCPAVSHAGDRLAYSGFDTAGYTIYVAGVKPLPDSQPAVSDTVGSLAPLETNVSLSSVRRKYFPIFNRVLISPIIVGEELISHDTAAQEGKFGVKAGGVLWLSDPLEKNSLFIMALMEVDKGVDWIGMDYGRHLLFNPKYDKEMMVLYENRSFYPTLSFEADKFLIHEDDHFYNIVKEKYEKDNYVIDVQRYQALARLQFFSPLRKLHFGLTYTKQNVDFYNIDDKFSLEYTFFKELNPTIYWTHLSMGGGAGHWRQEDQIDTRGTYIKFKYDYLIDSIMVDGSSWQESFEINNMGVLRPRYNQSDTASHRLTLDVRHARAFPFLPRLTVGGEARVSVASRPINNFLYPGVFMKSYAFLADQSRLTFNGRNTMRGEFYLRFPILRRLRKGLGILLFDKIYGMAFFEGAASAGIDPSEAGRQDLDEISRAGRKVESYMFRKQTHPDSARSPVYSDTRQEMEDSIRAYEASQGQGFVYDERDKHVIYEMLPEDTMHGFWQNASMLSDASVRMGFGLELRFENYIIPGYPFFVTLRYSQALDRDDISGSLKNYFTGNPFKNDNAFIYLNLGFSFDNWEYIDMPESLRGRKTARAFR